MGEAIRNAGTLDLPPEDEAFLAFVRGPFARAAGDVLGRERGTSVVDAIVSKLEAARANLSTLPLGQPSRGAPSARGAEEHYISDEPTLPYGASPAEGRRALEPATLALVETDSGFRDALAELLRARGHQVHLADDVEEVAALAEAHALEVVVASLEPGGFSFASDLRRRLGRAAPRLVLIGGTVALHAPRPGVIRVVPKQLDLSVALAIEGAASAD